MTAPSIKKRVWRRGERRPEAGAGRDDAGRNGLRAQPPRCQGEPKDTAQSPTPSWDSFTLAGAPELKARPPGREGGLAAAAGRPGGLNVKLRLEDRSFFTQVGGD